MNNKLILSLLSTFLLLGIKANAQVTVSGNVYNDIDGRTNVNGTGINTVNSLPLYAILVNSSGIVVQNVTVAVGGTFSFSAVASGNYTVKLGTTAGTVSSDAPPGALPSMWRYIAEDCCDNTGNDGVANGVVAVSVASTAVTNVNFGIAIDSDNDGIANATDTDNDNDGIANSTDIDDDNDGVLDSMEWTICSNANANSSGATGTGTYKNNLYWFNWNAAAFADGIQNGDTQSFTLTDGTVVTATFSNVVNISNTGGAAYRAIDMNTWGGSYLHQLYNPPTSNEAFYSGANTDVSFDLTFSAIKAGSNVKLNLVFVDAEATASGSESIAATTNGGIWKVLESIGDGGTISGLGSTSITYINTTAGNRVLYSEDATRLSVSIDAGGAEGVAFGFIAYCDSDGDGLTNAEDLDSDNDGCSDAYEAGATTVNTPNYQFTGTMGSNGLDNSKETAIDNGTINYTSTYSANATNSSVKACCPTSAGITTTESSCTANDSKVLSGSTVTLTGTGGTGYIWNQSGLRYDYYSGAYSVLPDFNALTPSVTGTIATFDLGIPSRPSSDNFAMRYRGYINILAAGTYTFYTNSDDGSKLYINGNQIVNNDGLHGTQEVSGTVTLSAGWHSIEVTFFEQAGSEVLTVSYEGPGLAKQIIPASVLAPNFNPLVVTPTTTSTYSVTVINGSGCTATANSTITVGTAPTANITVAESFCTANDGKIKSGQSATLTATGGGTYSWSNSATTAAITVSPTTTTTYTVTVANNICTATASTTIQVVSGDNDCDGIGDDTDIDDDNDGVLDTQEMIACGTSGTNTIYSFTGYQCAMYDAANQDSWANLSGASSFPTSAFSQIATFDYNEFAGKNNSFNIDFLRNPYEISTYSKVLNFSGANIPNDGSNDAAISFRKVISTSAEAGNYQFSLTYGDDHVFIYKNGVKQYQRQNAYSGGPFNNILTLGLNVGDVLEVVLVEEGVVNTRVTLSVVKLSNIGGGTALCDMDTDGDGVSNRFDLDSDNDSCSDSYEAGATTSTTANYQFTGAVGTNGLIDSKETVADNGTINYTSVYPNYAISSTYALCRDTDNDGIIDMTDIDDDNDGVPDMTDCETHTFYWSSAPAVSGMNATGTINGVGYTYTSSQNIGTTTNMYSIGTFPASYNVPNLNPTIMNTVVTNNTITFASPVANPILAFSSIGNPSTPVPIIFGQSVQILWSTGVVQNSATQVTGTEGFVILKIPGVFTSINFQYTAAETYVNLAFGAETITTRDTDNDGVIDCLDLDSDNDGCSDAYEAGATTSKTANYQFTGAVGTNGLINTKETTADNGIINYTSTFSTYAQNNYLNICTDTDNDNVSDVFDIDDDNDAILDIMECPNTNLVANNNFTTDLSNWTSSGGWVVSSGSAVNTTENVTNQTLSQTINFSNTKVSNSSIVVSFSVRANNVSNLMTGTAQTANLKVLIGSTQYLDIANGSTMTASVTPSNGAYCDIASLAITTTTGVFTPVNLTIPSSSLPSSGNLTFSFSATSDDFSVDDVVVLQKCADTDGDGTANITDLDSDGDGCSDAYESGATTTKTANYQFTGTVGTNGLDNTKETAVDNGTINYTSKYADYALANTLNLCTDTDNDGISNVLDIDDDNDGVLDNTEGCVSTVTMGTVNSTLTTQLSTNNTVIFPLVPTGATLPNGGVRVTKVSGTSNSWGVYTPPITTTTLTMNGFTSASFPTTYIDMTGTVARNLTVDFGTSANAISTVNNQYQYVIGIAGMGSEGASLSTTFSTPLTVLSNSNVFSTGLYSLLNGVASTTAGLTGTVVSTNTPLTTGQGYTFYSIPKSVSSFTMDLVGGNDPHGFIIGVYNSNCTQDTDGDGIANSLDLDSDNDGCSDAYEAGATTSKTTNYQFTGSVGTNGLDNSKETAVDNGTINYTSKYADYALANTFNFCTDIDNDGVSDILDIDDDNDGVLDLVECGNTIILPSSVTTTNSLQASQSELNKTIDGGTGTAATTFFLNGSTELIDKVTYNFGTALIGYNKILLYNNGGTILNDGQSITSIDSIKVYNSLGVLLYSTTAYAAAGSIPEGALGYPFQIDIGSVTGASYIQLINIRGTVGGTAGICWTEFSVSQCADTDGDGIVNSLDLDSDGDGCSDAYEAGATTSITANYQFMGTVGTNGLDNSKETVADNGTINYTSTYATNAINNSIKACCPTATITATENSCTANDDKIKTGQNAVLTASGGTGYTWSTSATTAAITVTPSVSTAYIVTVSNASGCTITATKTISLDNDCDLVVDELDIDDDNDGVLDVTESICTVWATDNTGDGIISGTLGSGNITVTSPTFSGANSGMNLGGLAVYGHLTTLGTMKGTFSGVTINRMRLKISWIDEGQKLIIPSNYIFRVSSFGLNTSSTAVAYTVVDSTITVIDNNANGNATDGNITTETGGLIIDIYTPLVDSFNIGVIGVMNGTTTFELCEFGRDTDGDGTANILDLDSDGDGCSDAYEGGATTNLSPNYVFTGTVGTNGLDNTKETADNGTINYTSTYNTNALSNTIKTCCPTVTAPTNQIVCAGGTVSAVSFSGNIVSGVTYNWVNNNTAIGLGASGTGNISSFTAINPSTTPRIGTITVTPSTASCTGTAQNFNITAYNDPVAPALIKR